MISYRKLIPCIYIAGGKAIKWFNDREVLADNVVELAKHYSDRGADELLIFDLSDSDDDHEASLNLLRQIHNVISIPMGSRRQHQTYGRCTENPVFRS